MRYVSAYMLAVLGGKANPTASDIEGILGSVGIDADGEKLKVVLSRLAGKSLPELIAEGSKSLVSVSGGGGAAAAPAAAAAAPAAAAPAEAKGGKKKEEPKEESDDDMGFGLFD